MPLRFTLVCERCGEEHGRYDDAVEARKDAKQLGWNIIGKNIRTATIFCAGCVQAFLEFKKQ